MDVSANNDNDDDDADAEDGGSDSEQEVDRDSEEEMDDGTDRLSEVSETYSSSSTYRSRIPVPVAGSYGKHLVSWK